MSYQRKTYDEYIIQGRYGLQWEDVTTELTWRDCKQTLEDYRENEPQYKHRFIKRRVKIEEATA